MPKINILHESLVKKIAAGEVIERPASVVKELLENSLDAKADEIKIEIESAGKKKIKVSDNGVGMDEQDALLCYKSHTTSKIKQESDLFKIISFGFRGEALASIAAVSNLSITTKVEESDKGILIELEAGKLLKKEYTGCPKGTIIEIKDLFFNLPARKKYLKADNIELSHILRIVTKYALINKSVSIKLIHNKRELINSPKTESVLNNIASIFGIQITKNLLEVDYSNNNIRVKGFISKPTLTRADKTEQYLYINTRAVRNNIISDAVYNAYHTLLFINRHPIFILDTIIPPEDIDVNVHPTKNIVRLKNESLVKNEVFKAIKKTFKENNLIVETSLEQETIKKPIQHYSFPDTKQTTLAVKEKLAEYVVEKKYKENKHLGPFNILGQINKTYIIAENPHGLAVIDQHAVQERVKYERFTKELRKKVIIKQKLMKPRLIELNPIQYEITKNNNMFFENLGFSFQNFGKNTLKLTSIPEIFGKLKSTIFIDIINELLKMKVSLINKEIEERIIRFACRASVKAGDELTMPQMKKLLEELEKADNPYSCPHGRPTIINLSIADLEKKFKRSGWKD